MTRWAAVSLVLAAAASLAWLIVPAYAGSGATLIEVNGARVLLPLTLPVVIALAPLMWPRRTAAVAAAVLLGAFVLVTGFSIGYFYAPALVAMAVAATRR